MSQAIKEEDRIHEEWYKQAKDIKTPEQLAEFTKRLLTDYEHDYGTICHACAAVAIAGAWCVNADEKQGGITGFQAGAIMWEFIIHWNKQGSGPLRLLEMENLLYPQYEDRFKEVSKDTWAHLQKKAGELLKTNIKSPDHIRAHWQSVVDGKVPFGFRIEKE